MKFKFNNKDIFFIHIPRTAGTYIEDSISRKYGILKKWPEPNTEILFGLLKMKENHFLTLQHLTLKEMIKFGFLDNKDAEIFTVIRNPYDRIISLYKNWFNKYETLDMFLDKLISMKLDEYTFNGIVTNKKDFNYLNMTDDIDDIRYFVLPQYYYIMQDGNEYGVDVIKYEEMEKINTKYGTNLKYSNRGGKYDFSDSQRDKIYQIFKKDFEYFEYDR